MDAGAWDTRYAASDQVWSSGPNQFVESELADLTPGRALDLACGEGRNAIWLARQGWDVTAMDFSAVAVDRGRARAAAEEPPLVLDWRVGDALSAPLPAVDLALLAYLQLPDDERSEAVRRSFAALEVGGTLFVIAHDSTNLADGTGGPQDPAVLYTAEEVLADLDGERFEVVRAERVTRHLPGEQPGETAVAYDALVRVVRTA